MRPTHLFGFRLRTLGVLGITLLSGAGALWLDLARDGPVADLLWNVTGETEPLPQLLGGVQYLANTTRVTPRLDKSAEMENVPDNPFGINAFLEQEADPENRERAMQLIAEAGFGWLRQHFTWEDIEIDGKGDFFDRRNDLDFDGEKDTISSWQKYDQIVDLAEQYGVQIIARVSSATPRWALPSGATNAHGPPADVQDYVDFAVAVAERYKGRITVYQIWNEPNLYPEWGDQLISPEGYTEMLCRTHDALKAVDPDIIVLTGALGPTIDLTGRDAYDLLFLQRLYDLGAGRCFDVLSAQGYGLFSGPTDRRMRPFTMNFARHEWLRDIMAANGDAHKPIWLSEIAWNPVPNDATISGIDTYGQVTMEQAAAWAPLAYERALEEWPWVGVMSYWFLKLPDESVKNQSWYYFRLVEPTWEPTPVYYSLQAYIQSGDWQRPDKPWSVHARERAPKALIIGWAVLFVGYILGDAVLRRLERAKAEEGAA
jgi:hypothetical protein